MTQTTTPPRTPSDTFWPRFRDLGSLRRPSDHRAVAGVAEGLSRHFDVDPTIVRVLFGALTFFGGAGIILYAALWLTVPTDDTGQSLISSRLHRDPQAWTTIGLAAGGIFAAAAALGSLSWAAPRPFPFFLCVLVVALVLLVVSRRGDRAPDTPSSPPTSTPPPPPAASPEPPTWTPAFSSAPTVPRSASTALAPIDASTTEILPTPILPSPPSSPPPPEMTVVEPYPAGAPDAAEPASRAWWQRPDPPSAGEPVPRSPVQAPPPARPRSHLFGLTMAIIALTEAALWIVDASTSADVHPSVYPGAALAITAVALLVSAWWGRARGLIAIGLVAGVLTGVAAFAGPGPYGDRSATPHQASGLQPSYRMGIGRFTLGLEHVADIEALNGRTVTINQRIGQLRVVIPSSVAAVVDATVDHGSIDGPTEVRSLDEGGERVLLNPDPAGRPTITLHLHVVYGDIRLERWACPGDGPAAADETTSLWNEGNRYVPAACN
jgi:phage shock protein PspC (stress-responsive transcriptional regulator)